jgi:Protein of unknown function (DUF1460)
LTDDGRRALSPAVTRRDLLRSAALVAAALALRAPLAACSRESGPGARPGGGPDQERLARWSESLRASRLGPPDAQLGRAAAHVGELAAGTPYEAHTLEAYLSGGGARATEPLTLSLTRFDCVTLVEACLAVARASAVGAPVTWQTFGRQVERMRYRGGIRLGYASRLHYFSEWIADGERRELVKDLGGKLGGVEDDRPLRFMTSHRDSYPALAQDAVFAEIERIERSLDGRPRHVVPTSRILDVADGIETGDVLAFATEITGLDVTHAAFAYRDEAKSLRVLHAPLSGGVVEVTARTLPDYVAAIRRSTGILIARPLWAPSSS